MDKTAFSALFLKDLRELMKPRYSVILVLLFSLFLGMFVYMIKAFPYVEAYMKEFGDLFLIGMGGTIVFVLPTFFFLQMLFVEEKLSGTVRSLLLTPLKPSEILFTKSLLSAVISSLFIAVMSLILIATYGGAVSTSLAAFLFLTPFLTFSLSSIMGHLALGRWKASVAMTIGGVMMAVAIQVNVWIPQGSPASQSVLLVFYAALTVVLFPVSIVIGRRLTRENIMEAV